MGPGERPEAYPLADRARRLPLGVPLLLVHGDADDRVPVEQSRRFAQRARAAGNRCELVELPGAGHFKAIDPRTGVWREIAPRVLDLASGRLGRG